MERRGVDESLDARATRLLDELAGRDDVDLMPEPATVASQADPPGGMDHATHPIHGPPPDSRVADVADEPFDFRIVPERHRSGSCQAADRVSGPGHVPRDVAAHEAAGTR